MKVIRFVCLTSVLVLAACSNEPDQMTSSNQTGSTAPKAAPVAEATSTEHFSADSIASTSTENKTVATQPAPDAKASPASMAQVASDTINQSNLTPAQKADMNVKVQNLMAAQGNQAQMAAAANVLVGLAAPAIPGFGLVDAAAAVAAVQDLIAAIMDADAAGIQDAIMDLIAAIAA